MPAPILFGVAAVGAGVSLLNNEKAAKSAQSAAEEQAKLYEQQAERIRERADLAIRQTRFEGQKLEGRQVVAYATSGVDISSGSALAVMEDTARQLNDQVTSIEREASFQEEMARTGANNIRAVAGDQRKASRIANYTNFAMSVTSAGMDYMKYQAATMPESEKVKRYGSEASAIEESLNKGVPKGKTIEFNPRTKTMEQKRKPLLGEIKSTKGRRKKTRSLIERKADTILNTDTDDLLLDSLINSLEGNR